MAEDDSLATTAPEAPITSERPVPDGLETSFPKPYLARALKAPDTDYPNGTPNREHNGKSVLQQHASFFDQDNNGLVYPWETFAGFCQLGFNLLVSLVMSVLINGLFSYATVPDTYNMYASKKGWLPNPLFPLYVRNIHKGKHGSDSGAYDTEGRFMPVNLEKMFSKYGKTKPGKLSFKEVWNMTKGNRVAYDILGGFVAKLEWILLYVLAKDEDGFLTKEVVRSCFDGSLFEQVAKKNKLRQDKSI